MKLFVAMVALAAMAAAKPLTDGAPRTRDYYDGYIKAITDNFDRLFPENRHIRSAEETKDEEPKEKKDEDAKPDEAAKEAPAKEAEAAKEEDKKETPEAAETPAADEAKKDTEAEKKPEEDKEVKKDEDKPAEDEKKEAAAEDKPAEDKKEEASGEPEAKKDDTKEARLVEGESSVEELEDEAHGELTKRETIPTDPTEDAEIAKKSETPEAKADEEVKVRCVF